MVMSMICSNKSYKKSDVNDMVLWLLLTLFAMWTSLMWVVEAISQPIY